MSIKATVKIAIDPIKKLTYPYLGYAEKSDFYILFVAPRKGMVVADPGQFTGVNRLGEWSDMWCENEFFVYTKNKVTIENV